MLKKFRGLALLIWIAFFISQGACADNSTEYQTQRAIGFLNMSYEISNLSEDPDYLFQDDLDYDLKMSAIDLSLLLVDRSLALDESLSQAWSQKGDLLFRSKRYEEAIECYNKLLNEDPTRKDIWLMKGESLMHIAENNNDIKRWDEAVNCYKIMLSCCRNSRQIGIQEAETNRQEAQAWLRMGQFYYWKADRAFWKSYENGSVGYDELLMDNEKAISCYRKTIDIYYNLDYSHADEQILLDALMGLGNSYMDTYRYDEAIHYYQKIVSEFDISSYPDHIYNAWKNMGISELKIAENLNGRDRENALLQAEQSFAKCIEIYPDWDSNFGRWAALHALGREKEAQAALDQSIRLAGGARIPFLQDLIGSLKEILTKLTGAHRDVSGN